MTCGVGWRQRGSVTSRPVRLPAAWRVKMGSDRRGLTISTRKNVFRSTFLFLYLHFLNLFDVCWNDEKKIPIQKKKKVVCMRTGSRPMDRGLSDLCCWRCLFDLVCWGRLVWYNAYYVAEWGPRRKKRNKKKKRSERRKKRMIPSSGNISTGIDLSCTCFFFLFFIEFRNLI